MAHELLPLLNHCTVPHLRWLITELDGRLGRMRKGGVYKPYRRRELLREARRCIGHASQCKEGLARVRQAKEDLLSANPESAIARPARLEAGEEAGVTR